MDFTNIGNASLETRRRRVQVLDFSEGGFATPLFEGNQGSEQPGKKSPAPGTPLDFVARGGALYANGQPFHVKGINWFGSESRTGAPRGMHKHPLDWYIDLLAENDFNAIRLREHAWITRNSCLELHGQLLGSSGVFTCDVFSNSQFSITNRCSRTGQSRHWTLAVRHNYLACHTLRCLLKWPTALLVRAF